MEDARRVPGLGALTNGAWIAAQPAGSPLAVLRNCGAEGAALALRSLQSGTARHAHSAFG